MELIGWMKMIRCILVVLRFFRWFGMRSVLMRLIRVWRSLILRRLRCRCYIIILCCFLDWGFCCWIWVVLFYLFFLFW